MQFEDGSCQWDDMKGHFEINRHALQIHTPMRDNGDIDCADADGNRKYPRLDYSKGFPDWWHLDRTDIKVPSEHTQHGRRYAAEVSLAHFYELDHYKNQIGYVSIFLQDYPGEKPWHYLDKLICEFRKEEEKRRSECGLPPAPVYKMCELFRGQERSPEDFDFVEDDATDAPGTDGQLARPPPIPLEDFGGDPDAKHFPLQLCQGDCDFTEDCAPGLICHRREAFEEVPGCIGGETLEGGSDFCVFDPFGEGYNPPTDVPTTQPTNTPRPTIVPLPPKHLVNFGGTPPLANFPLQRCQGDCDTDADCAEGLICYQRGANEAVPGCKGGKLDDQLTDYCVLDPLRKWLYRSCTDVVTDVPTVSPTVPLPPTAVPTTRATENSEPSPSPSFYPRPAGPPKQLWNRGWEPAFKLGECEGDCDEDSDCLPGLVCFDREAAGVAVPGCAGGEEDNSLTDYCVYPDLPSPSAPGADEGDDVAGRDDTTTSPATDAPTVAATTASPTDNPTAEPNGSTPTASADPISLNHVGWSPPADKMPLGLCEGDCDDDDDCDEGLVCFQRFLPMTAVPGCVGGEKDTSLMDFCIQDPTGSANPPTDEPTAEALVVPAVPTESDVVVSRTDAPDGVPEPIDCQAYKDQGVNVNRICQDDEFMCCQSPRSSSNYCHEIYDIFGDKIHSACHHCCLEERGEALEVGPANPPKAGLEPYTECDTALDNTARLCKEQSCCDVGFADTAYCDAQWAMHAGNVERICWYCCFPSKDFPEPGRRQLSETPHNSTINFLEERQVVSLLNETDELLSQLDEKIDYDAVESNEEEANLPPLHTAMTKEEMRQYHKNNPREIGPNDRFYDHPTMERKLIVREENYGPKDAKDEDAYFEELHSAFQQRELRELQEAFKENYDDVYWWPYEWLLKVGTEYYFRYEGSMTTPPCYTVNHWRVLKDPIRVAKHQITELERLLAWRINGDCDASTAGKPRDGNPDAVDVARPLQELERGHRMVFCECQDWPSKFPKDREWCKKWQTRDPELRLFDNPYNWPENGF